MRRHAEVQGARSGAAKRHDTVRAAAAAGPVARRMLELQRSAGNAAVSQLVVQRATATQVAQAKKKADEDAAAGNFTPYFDGNFLANHIEAASPQAQEAVAVKSTSSKAARSQAYKKLEQRSNVDGGGSGWQGGRRVTGTNTLILDYGPQKAMLMRTVNVGQIDKLATRPVEGFIHLQTAERMKTVTYSTGGGKAEETKQVDLGARYDPQLDRYRINHLGG